MKNNKIAFIIASLLLIILSINAAAASLTVSPVSQALDTESITCSYGEVTTPTLINWYWYKNGNSMADNAGSPINGIADATGKYSTVTLAASKTTVGDKWACEARSPTNNVYAKLATPVTIVAAPSAPTIQKLTVDDYSIPETQNAVCRYGEVLQQPGLLHWYFYKSGSSVAINAGNPIHGVADATGKYSIGILPASTSNYNAGDNIYCEVRTYRDAEIVGGKSTAPIVVEGTTTTGKAQITPYEPTTANSLTCTLEVTTGMPSAYNLVKFYWFKNGASVATYGPLDGTNIAGNPGNVLPTTIHKGETWTCKVYNYRLSYLDESTVLVQNAKPTITAPTLTPLVANTNTDLTCNAGTTTDADRDSVTVAYKWVKNGVTIIGQTSRTLSSNNFVKSDVIMCQTTPRDTENGITQTSNVITIQDSAATCTDVSAITKENIPVTLTMTCTDADYDEGIDTLTLNAITNPANGAVSAFTGNRITYTPNTDYAGTDRFTFTANSGSAATATITINATPRIKADFYWTPTNPTTGQLIQFTDNSTIHAVTGETYTWDFGEGNIKYGKNPTYTFTTSGDKTVKLTVTDGRIVSTTTKTVTVITQLNVTNIECFNKTIVGKPQSCTVTLNNGQRIGGANIQMYFADDSSFGSCTTSDLTGKCEIIRTMIANGTYTVYATATKAGYISDTDKQPTFTFEVWNERYDIIRLATYANEGYVLTKDTFYRGQPVYLAFEVVSKDDLTKVINSTDLVTEANLISPVGGRIPLTEYKPMESGRYFYVLPAIPLTHDFIGNSEAYAFAFNFTDKSGGQKTITLTILNNPPSIVGTIPTINASYKGITAFSLTPYESDLEDSGADLTWTITDTDSALQTANVDSADTLTIIPKGIVGTDTVTLTLKDLDGDSATQSVNIVFKNMPPTGDFTWDLVSPQISDVITFSATATDPENDPLTYTWNFGDGTPITTGNPKTHTYAAIGTYTVTLTISDGQYSTTITKTIVIGRVNFAPIASFTCTPMTPQEGQLVTCTDSSTDMNGDALVYLWNFGDSVATEVIQNPTHTYTLAGTYTITLTVSDGELSNTLTQTITVIPYIIPTPNLTVEFSWGPARPIEGQVVGFVDLSTYTGTGNLTYTWNLGNGQTSNTKKPTTTYATAGTYTVTLTVTDGTVTGTKTKQVFVDPLVVVDEIQESWLKVDKIMSSKGQVVTPGDTIEVQVTVKNVYGEQDFKDVSLMASIYDLGIVKRATIQKLGTGKTTTKTVLLNIPSDAQPGEYMLRLYMKTNTGITRIVNRDIIVE